MSRSDFYLLPVPLLLMVTTALAFPAPAAAQFCAVRCVTGEGPCRENTHQAFNDYEWDEWDGGSHTTCWAGVCCWDHPFEPECKHPCCENCIGGNDDEEQQDDQLVNLVRSFDMENWNAVRSLIAKYPDNVMFNADRRSLQIASSCRPGTLVANLPMSEEQVAALIPESTETWRTTPTKR